MFPAVTVCNLSPFAKNKTALKDHAVWGPFLSLESKTTTVGKN